MTQPDTVEVNMTDDYDERELEVAEMARRAAVAASERRKRLKNSGGGLTVDDVDATALRDLSALLEEIEAWVPGFAGAMVFHGEAAVPIVSLIGAADREATRRALTHAGTSTRQEIDYLEHDAFGGFVDSISSTTRGAVLAVRLPRRPSRCVYHRTTGPTCRSLEGNRQPQTTLA